MTTFTNLDLNKHTEVEALFQRRVFAVKDLILFTEVFTIIVCFYLKKREGERKRSFSLLSYKD